MKKPIVPRLRADRSKRHSERGVTMVLVATAMVAIIGIAALSIDVITLYLARQEAQRSADSAAMAAARVISLSGMTGTNNSASWGAVCGGASSPASLAAVAVATQNGVAGIVPSTPTVLYSIPGQAGVADCSALPTAFATNPVVSVQVRRTSLPTFFSRIWGTTSNSVSATATAEAFNPSGSSAATGFVTPVNARCVKPWLVPNQNPAQPSIACVGAACHAFVSTVDGSIIDPGVQPTTSTGVIGSTFNLFANCGAGSPCAFPGANPPQANVSTGTFTAGPPPATPNLAFVPGEIVGGTSIRGVPSCASSGGGGVPEYEAAVAGCDQTTDYHCGVSGSLNTIDLSENPGGPAPTGDSAAGIACLLTNDATTNPLTGQDVLDVTSYPYKIRSGASNPTGLIGKTITASNSVVSLPIYDSTLPLTFAGSRANVTIVGFLQVFVNQVGVDGSINVTVLNVAGCGNGAPNPAVSGNSPVPARLITLP
jgi:Putative Flp pilus-assembly TadE/G-like